MQEMIMVTCKFTFIKVIFTNFLMQRVKAGNILDILSVNCKAT